MPVNFQGNVTFYVKFNQQSLQRFNPQYAVIVKQQLAYVWVGFSVFAGANING
jgi:hypothetical protein